MSEKSEKPITGTCDATHPRRRARHRGAVDGSGARRRSDPESWVGSHLPSLAACFLSRPQLLAAPEIYTKWARSKSALHHRL
jgi:hypothetical protein